MTQIFAFATLFVLVSCATGPYKPYPREVKKKPGVEGVVSLKLNHVQEDRTYADTMMIRNCGTNTVTVIEEGEVAVGSTTVQNSAARDEKEENGFNMAGMKFLTGGSTDTKKTTTQTETVAVKEWHINYTCKTTVAENTVTTKKNKKK